ncbi:Hsp33 family molecular chaperone HslO [Bhargavaea beijingensis]|uniref:33 kDa chaperonin n=1 Tax=Bhargavaea beijingensis TaxID=426756 RepID=A0A1G7FMU0_9BACL|nr:Hsp33 family molecular chaperone HslO [Bhargavaea beijingensis]MCW1929461.1 Hsp33 family molecular chaperone HslO [Bhargavaea beijingensis]RSK24895.1 Hsp33 family molecular chaperone HslO [Bhargavaea beijingensis]SDE77267.1 molecular chaperone Hsp33 [Bhargavaea beijingensis]
MSDYIVKGLAFDGTIRVLGARTTETVGEAQRRHQAWPTASAALGRTLTGTVMLGSMLKGDGKLTVKIEGGGPAGAILADADANGHVRGYISDPYVHFDLNSQGKLDVRRAVGTNGMFSVVKDLGLRDHFTGQVPIVSGEIAEDFTQYLTVSEQVPSAVALGVLVNPDNTVKAAGGFIIQVMPGASDETITLLEERITKARPVSRQIEDGLNPEEVLQEVLGTDNVRFIDNMPVSFNCDCSKERFGNAIQGLGDQEIREMIEEDHGAEAQCHFCLEKYQFSEDELRGFLSDEKDRN